MQSSLVITAVYSEVILPGQLQKRTQRNEPIILEIKSRNRYQARGKLTFASRNLFGFFS